jgi:hypothetical protein
MLGEAMRAKLVVGVDGSVASDAAVRRGSRHLSSHMRMATCAIQVAQARRVPPTCGPTLGRDSHPKCRRTSPPSPGLVTLSHPVKHASTETLLRPTRL